MYTSMRPGVNLTRGCEAHTAPFDILLRPSEGSAAGEFCGGVHDSLGGPKSSKSVLLLNINGKHNKNKIEKAGKYNKKLKNTSRRREEGAKGSTLGWEDGIFDH